MANTQYKINWQSEFKAQIPVQTIRSGQLNSWRSPCYWAKVLHQQLSFLNPQTTQTMEWISFSMDSEKRSKFEKELMPMLCNRYGSLLEMSDNKWAVYYEKNGLNNYQCLFCTDSVILLKFVKEYAGNFNRLFATPKTNHMEYFGPQNATTNSE